MKKNIITRRSLLKKAAALAAGSALLMNLPVRVFGSTGNKQSREHMQNGGEHQRFLGA